MGVTREVLEFIIKADGSAAASSFKGLGAQAEAASAKLGASSKAASSELSGLGSAATSAGAGLSGGILAAAGAVTTVAVAAGKFAIDQTVKFKDLALSVGAFADATGLSTEQASRLAKVSEELNVPLDAVQGSIAKMAKAQQGGVLDKLGVDVARFKNGTVDLNGTLLNVVDHLNSIPDAAQRDAEAAKIFGKGWQNIAPLITEPVSKLKEQLDGVQKSSIISPGQVAEARSFRDAMNELHNSLQAVGQTIGATLLPFMSQLARDAATVTTPLQSLSGSGAHTAAVLGDVAGSVTSLIPGGTVAGAAINFLSGQVDSAATSADKANAKMKALKDAAQNLQQGFDASGRSAAGFVGDMSSAEVQASLSAAAQKDLADSVAKTAEVQKEQADASKALADGAKLASEWVKTLNDAEQAQFDTTRQLLGLEVEVPKKLEEVATAASDADKAFAAASKSGGKNADLNQKAADSYLALKDKILSTSDSLQKQSDQLDKSKGKTDTAYQSTLHYAEGLLTSAGSSKTAQLAALGFEQQLKDIPKDTQARVSTLVNEGRLPEAVALLQQVEGTHYSQAILSVAVIGDINTFRTITAQVGGGLSVTAKRFKASGGPVSGGTAYVVGEKGPEMFVPSTAGTIIPNGGGIGGGSVTINIGSVQANNPGELIYALEKFVQNNGKARLQRLVGV